MIALMLTLALMSPAQATEIRGSDSNFNSAAVLDVSQAMTADDAQLSDALCLCDDAALWWRGYFEEGNFS